MRYCFSFFSTNSSEPWVSFLIHYFWISRQFEIVCLSMERHLWLIGYCHIYHFLFDVVRWGLVNFIAPFAMPSLIGWEICISVLNAPFTADFESNINGFKHASTRRWTRRRVRNYCYNHLVQIARNVKKHCSCQLGGLLRNKRKS